MPSTATPSNPNKSQEPTLATKILNALESLVTLEIRTIVGDVTVSGTGNNDLKTAYDKVPLIETQINMLLGDTTTAINSKFVDDPNYKFLLDYHAKREEKGYEMVQDNVKALMSLLKLSEQANQ
ncbi:MAG: hypothetical protein JKY48_09905 [Flavobacteriales bacterium]|nr:hypothetical protein [Flavobacteriales bacterium]